MFSALRYAIVFLCLLPLVSAESFTVTRYATNDCTGDGNSTGSYSSDDGCLLSTAEYDDDVGPTAFRIDCAALNTTSFTGKTCTSSEIELIQQLSPAFALLYYQLDDGQCVDTSSPPYTSTSVKLTERSIDDKLFCFGEDIAEFVAAATSIGIVGITLGDAFEKDFIAMMEALWTDVIISDVSTSASDGRRKLLEDTTTTVSFTMKTQVVDGDADGTFDSMVSTLSAAVSSGDLEKRIESADMGTFDETSYTAPASYSMTVGTPTDSTNADDTYVSAAVQPITAGISFAGAMVGVVLALWY